jgi:hypothetical protein
MVKATLMIWRRFALLATGLLLSSCSLLPTPPSLPTPVRPPEIESAEEALRATVDGNYPLDALAIRYEIGNEAWQGRTTLVAYGDGRVEVAFDRGGQHSTWQSTLTEAEFLALVRLLVDHQVWAIHGQRESGVPDEAYPTVVVEAEGFEPLQVGMWQGEAQDHPDFQPIANVLAGLASQISGGGAN